jgi:hypothetical protein
MAGYSSTPLIKKLGIKEGALVLTVNEPTEYWDLLAPLPEVQIVKSKKEVDFIHVFVTHQKEFKKEFLKRKAQLKKDGMMWISWPKKSSKVPSDLDENIIRDFGLTNDLVDVKVCAVTEVWSGLKFMYRLKDR